MDEAHRFITPELAEALETMRQKGICYCLAAQHLSQFKTQDGDDRVYKAIKSCVRNKVVFAIPDRMDATDIADDVFGRLSEPDVKLVRSRLSHLIEDVRDQSITRGNGNSSSWSVSLGHTDGTTQTKGLSAGLSESEGKNRSREASQGTSRTFSRGQTSQISTGESHTHTENNSTNRGFSETRTSQRSSSSASSKSETIHERNRTGLFDSSEGARSVSTGGSSSKSDSEGHSRTDTGSDSHATGEADTVTKSESRGGSKSLSWSRSRSSSEGASVSSTISKNSERSSSDSISRSTSNATSEGQSATQSYSTTDQPSARHHPFWEKHEEYWTLEERRWRAAESLMRQSTGCWYASTLAGNGFGGTRLPKKFYILPKRLLRLTGQLQETNCLSPERADELLLQREKALFSLAAAPNGETSRPAREPESPIWSWDRTARPTNSTQFTRANGQPRRGPKPDTENHTRVATIISGYGDSWTTDDNLMDICEKLDQAGLPVPKTWPTLREHPARAWLRALQHHRDLVKKAIRYSCKVASLDNGQTPKL